MSREICNIFAKKICEKIGGVKMATCKGLWVHVTTSTKPKVCQLFMNAHILIVDQQLTPPELHLLGGRKFRNNVS